VSYFIGSVLKAKNQYYYSSNYFF